MLIELDNMQTAHPLNQRLTGKIKTYLQVPFQAANVQITLNGFIRSQFCAGSSQHGCQKTARLAHKLCTVTYTIAEFEEGHEL